MRLAALLLADQASARDNLLYVIGGGINLIGAPEFPVPLVVSLAGMLQLAPGEEGDHTFQIRLRRRSSRRDIARAEGSIGAKRKPDQPEHATLNLVFAVDLRPLTVPDPGEYELVLSVDGRRLGATLFIASRRDTPFGAVAQTAEQSG